MRCGSTVLEGPLCLLLAVVALLLCCLMSGGLDLAGGGAGEPISEPGQPIPEERCGVGDVGRPVSGVRSGVVVKQCGEVATCPTVAVDELIDDVDQRPEVLSGVESVCPVDELGGDALCSQ